MKIPNQTKYSQIPSNKQIGGGANHATIAITKTDDE